MSATCAPQTSPEVLNALRIREQRFNSSIAEIYALIFQGEPAYVILRVFLNSGPLSLAGIARACGKGKRSKLSGRSIRNTVDRLLMAGMLTKQGTKRRPLYALVQDDQLRTTLEILYYAGPEDGLTSRQVASP